MDAKKIGVVVALVVVIVIAAVLTAKRARSTGAPAANATSTALAGQKVDMIDKNTFEIFTETAVDWHTKYAPDASGYYRNPKTGEYTVASIIKCASCGQLIPAPVFAHEGRTTRMTTEDRLKEMQEEAEIRRNYKCPKCGKNAYAE
jgi:DNA-directed RNA polymerase subunit RPC12/RpoP